MISPALSPLQRYCTDLAGLGWSGAADLVQLDEFLAEHHAVNGLDCQFFSLTCHLILQLCSVTMRCTCSNDEANTKPLRALWSRLCHVRRPTFSFWCVVIKKVVSRRCVILLGAQNQRAICVSKQTEELRNVEA